MNQLQALTQQYKDNKDKSNFFDFFQIRLLNLQKKTLIDSNKDEFAI